MWLISSLLMRDPRPVRGGGARNAEARGVGRHNDSDIPASHAALPGAICSPMTTIARVLPAARMRRLFRDRRAAEASWAAIAAAAPTGRGRRRSPWRDAVVLRAVRAAPRARASGLRAPRRLDAAHRDDAHARRVARAADRGRRRRAQLRRRARPPRRDALLRARALGRRMDASRPARLRARGRARSWRRPRRRSHAPRAAVPPRPRDAWWQRRAMRSAPCGGPGGARRSLPRIALEWAAAAPDAASTDRAVRAAPVGAGSRCRPAAPTALADRRCSPHGDAPALVVDTDVPLDRAVRRDRARARTPDRRRCASATASRTRRRARPPQVLDHLARGERPVALVAQDRVLVRRVRALLERAGVAHRRRDRLEAVDHACRRERDGAAAARRAPTPSSRRLARLAQVLAADRDARSRARSPRSKRSAAAGASRAAAVDRGRALHGRRGASSRGSEAMLDAIRAPSRRRSAGWLDALHDALERCGALARCTTTTPAARCLPRSASTRRAGDAAHRRRRREPLTLAEFTRLGRRRARATRSFVPERRLATRTRRSS